MGNTEETEQSLVEVHAYPGQQVPKTYFERVRHRWARSFRQNNDYIKLIDAAAYYQAYPVYILNVLNRPTTVVRVAVLADDHDVLLGYSVMEFEILHYVEVPTTYRKQGIAKNLVPGKVKWFSHLTHTGKILWPRLAEDAKFSPFL